MTNKKQTFVIIDGNAIVHRAYHALPPLTARDGSMVNAVYGFTSMLLKVINDLKPDYLAVSFDVAGGTFRDEVYEAYKATRVKADQELYDQIPLVYEVVEAFDIPIYVKKGYEADDVIATVAKKIRTPNSELRTIIVTGDMDLLQLVDDNKTEVYLLRKGMSDFHLYDEKAVKDRFGFGPEHVVDYKALRGDSSDNIPGVKGIGEKTAKELIEKIGGVEEIYKQILNSKSKIINEFKESVIKKLQDGEKAARMSEDLATIREDVGGLKFKLEDCEIREFDVPRLESLFRKFEFYSLVKRIPGYKGKEIGNSKLETGGVNKRVKLEIVNSTDNVRSFLKDFKSEKLFACKEVLSGKDVLQSELVGLVFVTLGGQYYVELGKLGKKESEKIFEIFFDAKKTLIGHDVKQLAKALLLQGVEIKNKLFDVMIASYLINSSTRAHDLKTIIFRELGKELPSGSDQGSLFGLDPKIVAQELRLILETEKKYKKQLEDLEDLGLFEKMEMPLILVLAEMELNGIAVDTKVLAQLSKDAAAVIEKVTKKIYKEAEEEFNIASSVQLREVLFEKMGLPTEGIKKGKTGYSTAAPELEKLRGVHPIIEMTEEFREVEKLRNTYIDVLPGLINRETGRIHTTFNQAVTTTGRLSSSDPNLQNIPIRSELGKEIRNSFIAEKGNVLIVADYSQVELRIVASLAQDKKMIEIFKKGEDIHKATAAAINGVPLDKVTKQMRYAAKEVNFGVLYGMGAYGLSWRAGIPQWQAKEFIQKYFEQFAGVKKYIDQTLQFAKKEGYVETLFGRRRYIPELKSGNFQLKNAGERMAINMPIQGTAADLMKLAMLAVQKRLCEFNANSANNMRIHSKRVKMILQVHDELVLEVKKGLENKVGKIVKEAMEGVAELRVPVEVHVDCGKRWGELK